MASSTLPAPIVRGIVTCVPARTFDNVSDTTSFTRDEVRKVVAMAGVGHRHVVDVGTCSSDLCYGAAVTLLEALAWDRSSVDGLVFVTQTPDYVMPSSSCVLQERLGLSSECAAYDLGLGCSGYVYGLWLAALMLQAGGLRRVLLLHGETPTLYADEADRSVSLLFGDAGSATALERQEVPDARWTFVLRTDGSGYQHLIVRAGGFRDRFCPDRRSHYVSMDGAEVFNFTIRTVPPLIEDTLRTAGLSSDDVDYYVFHQSNRFIIRHLMTKCGLPVDKVPMTLDQFGNTGGPSVPLTITRGIDLSAAGRTLRVLLLGYGVGLSWGAALVTLPPGVVCGHVEWENGTVKTTEACSTECRSTSDAGDRTHEHV
ncbi:MAG: ketoacyl-ACP synthase III [Armatimonadota bacterium]|nr:ketoacyl-ACP synthase III [Armatimonadota bacterium]